RAAPGTSFDAWTTKSDGSSVSILCQTDGTTVSGTYGTTSLWDMLANGGFVSDAYVYTGSGGQGAPSRRLVRAPPRAHPPRTKPRDLVRVRQARLDRRGGRVHALPGAGLRLVGLGLGDRRGGRRLGGVARVPAHQRDPTAGRPGVVPQLRRHRARGGEPR